MGSKRYFERTALDEWLANQRAPRATESPDPAQSVPPTERRGNLRRLRRRQGQTQAPALARSDDIGALWIADIESEVDPVTADLYEMYVGTHFTPF